MKYKKRVPFHAQQITIFPLSQKTCNGSLEMLKNPGKEYFYDIYQLLHKKHCQSEMNSNFLNVLHSELRLKFMRHHLEEMLVMNYWTIFWI